MKKNKDQRFALILLAILTVLCLIACSANNPGKQTDPDNKKQSESNENNNSKTEPDNKKNDNGGSVKPKDVEQAIAKVIGDGYLCTADVDPEAMFTSAIGSLDPEKVKSYVAKEAIVSSVNPDCVVVAEVAEGYAAEAVNLINEFYANTVSYIRQYPFSVAKVEGARLYRFGNTIVYVIAGAPADENASAEQAAKLAISEYEKIDNAIKQLFGSLPENLAVIPD
jgi:hypothetical protein